MKTTADHIQALLSLTLTPESGAGRSYVSQVEDTHWPELLQVAEAHHVTLRAFAPLLNLPPDSVPDRVLCRIRPAIEAEHR